MSRPTLYAPGLAGRSAGAKVELDADEAGHVRALRLRSGDELEVTDGRGSLWKARLEPSGASAAACALLEPLPIPPSPAGELAFGVANKNRTLWLVEKAVELGARRLQPVEFARSWSVADAGRSRGFWSKAERRAVAALKQSGAARLPEIGPPVPLEEYLRRATGEGEGAAGGAGAGAGREAAGSSSLRFLADADGRRTLMAALSGGPPTGGVRVLVGPEGGLAPPEADACRTAGFEPVRLGSRTLRFETAAIAALAVLAQWSRV